MCLDSVNQVYDKPQKGVKCGYKIYQIDAYNRTVSAFCEPPYEGYDLGDWYESYNCEDISTGMGKVYPVGFHVFRSLRTIKAWLRETDYDGIIHKVEYDRVIATGKDFGFLCDIALDIRVVKKASK